MKNLAEGLFVEDKGFLIPWGVSNEEAWKIGNPKPFNLPQDRTRMIWENAIIFDDLECTIQVWFPEPNSKLSKFNILDAAYDKRSPEDWAGILRKKCRVVFGRQTGENAWRQNNVTLSIQHDARFVEAYWLEIAKTD